MKLVKTPPTEVRIGNLFYSVRPRTGDKVVSVTDITREGFLCDSEPSDDLHAAEIFAPISIDEEWLAKWGFQKDRETGGYTEYSHPWLTVFFKLIHFDAGGSKYRLSFCAGKECYSPSLEGTFQHVHDLQNLIFAIVRKEISEYKSIEEIVKNWK